jgi:DNA-binding CsgD family transcriptional regulator
MLANGMQSKEVAAVLKRSTSTIEFHVRMLLGKFDARSRAHLVACAIYDGSIGSEDFEGVSSDAVS